MKYLFTSLTRIADLSDEELQAEVVPRGEWADGDYVVAEVTGRHSRLFRVEMRSGRISEVFSGDLLVGALGRRAATLEVVGDWRAVDDDLQMHALTAAGLMGKATSASTELPPPMRLRYRGHAAVQGARVAMRDFVEPVTPIPYETPTVLISGTSMSAGKTTTAKVVVRLLKESGARVAGAKLTGAGRYRDILAMHDAGADTILDFVDAGLPSTACPEDEFREAAGRLLSRLEASGADVAVVEVGASPLEPYNGAVAMELLGDAVIFKILCASDPYAAVGVIDGFKMKPDVVTGLATSTEAGVELAEKLTGLPAVNLLGPGARPVLRELLREAIPTLEER